MEFEGRPNTIKTKRSLFKNWVEPCLEPDGKNFDEVVRDWERQLEPATVKSLIYISRDFVRQSTGTELATKAHISRVGRSKQQKMPSAFSKPEIAALVQALEPSDPLYLPFYIGLHTGARRGEIWGLQWDDIDILNDQITIQRSYDGPTKSGKSRIVPISFALEQVFLANRDFITYNTYKAEGKRKRSINKNVVPHHFDPNPQLRGLMKKAGVPVEGRTWHSLRHTFATMALEAGKSPKLVSLCLGHQRLSTTLDIYWQASKEKLSLDFLDE